MILSRGATNWRRSVLRGVTSTALGAAGLVATAAAGRAVPAGNDPGSLPATVSLTAASSWQFDGRVEAAVIAGSTAYVGGEFTHAIPPAGSGSSTRVARTRLAAIDLGTGKLLGWNPGANAKVWGISASPDGSRIYVGGDFTMVGGASRSKIAAFSRSSGALLSWSPRVSGRVRPILVTSGYVYIGGNFTKVFDKALPRLARLNPTSGAVDASWTPRVNQIPAGSYDPSTGGPAKCPPRCSPEVTSLALANTGNIYVGGHFGLVNGVYRNNAAEVTSAGGSTMAWNPNIFKGTPTNPNQRNFVYGIAVSSRSSSHPGRVFLCGDYYLAGNKVSPNLAAVDAVSGAYDTHWRASTDGGTPACVLGPGDLLYIGGHFRFVGGIKAKTDGVVRNHVAAIPASTPPLRGGCYCAYPNSWNPNLNSVLGTHAIATSSAWIVVGGDFTTVNGKQQARFAQFRVQ
jgi:hypothetical protein